MSFWKENPTSMHICDYVPPEIQERAKEASRVKSYVRLKDSDRKKGQNMKKK